MDGKWPEYQHDTDRHLYTWVGVGAGLVAAVVTAVLLILRRKRG